MMTLNNIQPPKGAQRPTKRLGRGQGSGQGTQAGKGHKGQKARSGGGMRTGFEGGALPLYMKLPKKGFSNKPFKKDYALINTGQLNERFKKNGEVNRKSLIEVKLLKGINKRLPIKILAKGKLEKALNFSDIVKFSKRAEEIIEKLGGSISRQSPSNP